MLRPLKSLNQSRLTAKEARFVEAIVSGEAESGSAAVRIAGYSAPTPQDASKHAAEVIKRPVIQSALKAEAAKRGLNHDFVFERLHHFATDSDESWKRAPGMRAVEHLSKILGMVEPEKTEIDARTVIFQSGSAAAVPDLEAALERLLTERASLQSPTETP